MIALGGFHCNNKCKISNIVKTSKIGKTSKRGRKCKISQSRKISRVLRWVSKISKQLFGIWTILANLITITN